MNNKLKIALSFMVGVIVGAVGMNAYLKKEVEDFSNEEVWTEEEVDYPEPERGELRPAPQKVVRLKQRTEPVDYNAQYRTTQGEDVSEGPYVISVEEFNAEDRRQYDKISIFYYEEDDTLTDDNEEIIPNGDDLIGYTLSCFGMESRDPDIVYVRNDKLGADYEIVRLRKSYQEVVMGITALPPKVPRKKVKHEIDEDTSN